MMAGRASLATTCGDAVRMLLSGGWDAWAGLPESCSLASIEREIGDSSVLDSAAYLGSEAIACTRSTLDGAPVLVWHRQDQVLLIECDLVGAPRNPPSLDRAGIHRLDIDWGPALIAGGEAVIPELGLSLILTSRDMVVVCRGFVPTSLDEYVATRRPPSQRLKPFRPLPPRATVR